MKPDELPSLPPLPGNSSEPVFNEPWEASAFAIAVSMNQAGLFTWSEWVGCLSEEIKAAEAALGGADQGAGQYYRRWIAALEKLVIAKNILDKQTIDLKQQYFRENPVPHDHNARREPIAIARRSSPLK
jgi:nitrile hydratase accessory protein